MYTMLTTCTMNAHQQSTGYGIYIIEFYLFPSMYHFNEPKYQVLLCQESSQRRHVSLNIFEWSYVSSKVSVWFEHFYNSLIACY